MMQMRVALNPFDTRQHGRLLKQWLSRPHVARWWRNPEQHLAIALNPPQHSYHAVIAADDQPVGYLHWRRVGKTTWQRAGLTDIPSGAVDMNILIGEPEFLGQRIGPRALRLLLGQLRRDPSIPLVGVTVPTHHVAAIRAYEKAGFRRSHHYAPPGSGPSLLLVAKLQDPDLEEQPRTIMP